MELWEQILMGAMGLLIVFFFFPGIKATMERSKNAEEKHWGSLLLLTAILVAFIIFLISSVQ